MSSLVASAQRLQASPGPLLDCHSVTVEQQPQWCSHKAQPSLAPEGDIRGSVSGVQLALDGKRLILHSLARPWSGEEEDMALWTGISQWTALSSSRVSSGSLDKPQLYFTGGYRAPDIGWEACSHRKEEHPGLPSRCCLVGEKTLTTANNTRQNEVSVKGTFRELQESGGREINKLTVFL